MLHVGMNIAEKSALFAEVAHIPGALQKRDCVLLRAC
jgi:hypothetical protein